MNKWIVIFGILASVFLGNLSGCSSKKEEVAMAPVPPAPVAPPPAPMAEESDDSTGGGEDSSVADDSSYSETTDEPQDEPANEDVSMTNASEDDPTMSQDDAPMDESSGPVLARAKPKNLREQAEQAFGDGMEKAAYRLMQAHLLASPTEASELLAHYRWSPSRRQPQLGVRVAVGINLTLPPEAPKDYKPIGSLKGFFAKRKPVTRGRPAELDAEPVDEEERNSALFATNDKERILQKYTGLMGDVLVDFFKTSHAEGQWSPMFQSLTGVVPTGAKYAGGEPNDDGSGAIEDYSAAMVHAPMLKAELSTPLTGDEATYISVGPVLTYIGTGKPNELIDKAKSGEFDSLVIYDVEITLNLKLKMIYNECRARVISLADGKTLASSKTLKNTEAQKEIDKSGRTYVVTAMQPVLKILTENVALKEIPSVLTSEMIKTKRLGMLLQDENRSKLDALAEVRLYRENGLLDDSDLSAAFESLLGPEDGKLLASGTDQERLAIVKKLLAGS